MCGLFGSLPFRNPHGIAANNDIIQQEEEGVWLNEQALLLACNVRFMLVKMKKIVCPITLLMGILFGYLVLYIPFHYPHGIAVNDTGTVYVCDTGSNRVQRFKA